jgi:hypothetical protein
MKPTPDEQREMLEDWRALCEWLEARPYNASYDPRCRGAYLLATPYTATRTIRVDDPDAPPLKWGGREVPRQKDAPNPNLAEELEHSRYSRMLTRERKRLGLVFWSTGHGWRLHKDYREKLKAEAARLAALELEAARAYRAAAVDGEQGAT